jgi:glycosyltransferase involved in cell wall biosynthesis
MAFDAFYLRAVLEEVKSLGDARVDKIHQPSRDMVILHLKGREDRAKLLINPRPVNGKLDTRYNFPSKLMEYMQSGRPVITTRLLGIPEEYDGYMYFFEDDTKQKLAQGIRQVLSEDEARLSAFGSRARKYVNENKNSRVIAKKIFRLMNGEEVGNEENNR